MTDATLGLLLILVALGLLFAVLACLADAYCSRRRPHDILPPPARETERRGSVMAFYREVGTLDRHRKKWMA